MKYCCKQFKKAVEEEYNIGHYYNYADQDLHHWYMRFFSELGGEPDVYRLRFCPFCGKYLYDSSK